VLLTIYIGRQDILRPLQLRPTPDTADPVTLAAATRTPNYVAFIAVSDLCSAGAAAAAFSI